MKHNKWSFWGMWFAWALVFVLGADCMSWLIDTGRIANEWIQCTVIVFWMLVGIANTEIARFQAKRSKNAKRKSKGKVVGKKAGQ